MTHSLRTALIGLSLVITTAAFGDSGARADVAGRWQGAIELPGTQLEIVVSLLGTTSSWSGSIDIPAQNLAGFALSNVVVEGAEIHFEMAGVPGLPTFDGTLAPAGREIAGRFRQGGQTFPFALSRSEAQSTAVPDHPASRGAASGDDVVGHWLGALTAGSMTLRLALQIEVAKGGELRAKLESLDQATEVPVARIDVEGRVVRLDLPAAGASFRGGLSQDGGTIEGIWEQAGRSLPLTFARQAERVTLRRPQEPVAPFPYTSRDVSFRNHAAGLSLAGTLVVPQGAGPFPAVLFVSGSGPQDRDELIMGHRPFLVLADHLARHGIASLRYDDRGFGQSEGDHMGSTVGDFATDVEAALAFLFAQPQVDRRAVGILGHSEGGVSGPLAAVAGGEVAFLVLLAPPGVPLDRLMARQTADLLRLRGVQDSLAKAAVARQVRDLELVKDVSLDREQLIERLRASSAEVMAELDDRSRRALGLDEGAVEQSIAVAATPWFRSLMRIDPASSLRRITVPVLALFGAKDLQVAADENAAALRAALAEAGNLDIDVRTLPGLNHLFQHAETGGVDEYGLIEETIAPEVLDLVSQWIRRRFPRPAER
jgi:pimeloyl-ACP methyl ester carboxylesterase